MDDFDRDKTIKNHKEIIQMIDEIREFEDIEIDLDKDVKKNDEIIEIENRNIEYDNILVLDEENKNKFFNNLKKIHFTSNPDKREKIEKFVIPNTFNVGFNKNGDLVNLDLKNKKSRSKKKFSLKFRNLLKRNKKTDNDEKSDDTDTSTIGKIKNKLNFVSKLKKILPIKSKEENE